MLQIFATHPARGNYKDAEGIKEISYCAWAQLDLASLCVPLFEVSHFAGPLPRNQPTMSGRGRGSPAPPSGDGGGDRPTRPPTMSSPSSGGHLGLCKALFDFKGEREGDLSLQAGDVIRVIQKNPRWWAGVTADGRSGVFPSNFVSPVDDEDEAAFHFVLPNPPMVGNHERNMNYYYYYYNNNTISYFLLLHGCVYLHHYHVVGIFHCYRKQRYVVTCKSTQYRFTIFPLASTFIIIIIIIEGGKRSGSFVS